VKKLLLIGILHRQWFSPIHYTEFDSYLILYNNCFSLVDYTGTVSY